MRHRSPLAALIMLAVGVISLSFVPAVAQAAWALWLAGLILMVIALALSVRQTVTTAGQGHSTRSGKRPVVGAVALFVAFAVAGALVVKATDSAPTPSQVDGLPISREVAQVDEAAVPAKLASIKKSVDSLIPLSKGETKAWADEIRNSRFETKSSLAADWANAQSFVTGTTRVLTVPLLGTNLPEVSKVTFMETKGATSITEMASQLTDVRHAAFRMWQDGVQTKNILLERPSTSGGTVTTAGISWDRLNTCLNNIGISWAVMAILGVACGAACATAVLCLPCIAAAAGFTSGSLAKCVSNSFT